MELNILRDIFMYRRCLKLYSTLSIIFLILGMVILTVNNFYINIAYISLIILNLYHYLKNHRDLDYTSFIYELLYKDNYKMYSIICLNNSTNEHRIVLEIEDYNIAKECLDLIKEVKNTNDEYFLFEYDILKTNIEDEYDIKDSKINVLNYVLSSFDYITEDNVAIDTFETKEDAEKIKEYLSKFYKNKIFDIFKLELE